MKKMKTVFVIDRDNGSVAINKVNEGSEWVVNNEGVATIKFDGTSCLVKDGKLFKRYDRKLTKKWGSIKNKKQKQGKDFIIELFMFKEPPEGFVPCEDKPDMNTGHWPGWVPVSDNDKHHLEAFSCGEFEDGTYELVGEKVQNNIYNLNGHQLWKHGRDVVNVGRSFDELKEWLDNNNVEGLVFHHPDGRMAKIRRKDFNFKWNNETRD